MKRLVNIFSMGSKRIIVSIQKYPHQANVGEVGTEILVNVIRTEEPIVVVFINYTKVLF